jgi:hypothetical protein
VEDEINHMDDLGRLDDLLCRILTAASLEEMGLGGGEG